MKNKTGDIICIKDEEFVAIVDDNLPATLFFKLRPHTNLIDWCSGRKFIDSKFYFESIRKLDFDYMDKK